MALTYVDLDEVESREMEMIPDPIAKKFQKNMTTLLTKNRVL